MSNRNDFKIFSTLKLFLYITQFFIFSVLLILIEVIGVAVIFRQSAGYVY